MTERLPYSVWQRHELIAQVGRHALALDLARTLSTQYGGLEHEDDATTWVYEGRRIIAMYYKGLPKAIEERN